MSVLFPHRQERCFQQTDQDLQQRREGWLHRAAGLHLRGAPHSVLPEQVSGPVQCQTGHTAVVPCVETPTGELTPSNENSRLHLRKNPAGRARRLCVHSLLFKYLFPSQQVVTEIDIDAVGQQLRMLQDQYKEKSKEYDLLYETFNQTSQVRHFPLVHLRFPRRLAAQTGLMLFSPSSLGPAEQTHSHRGFQ